MMLHYTLNTNNTYDCRGKNFDPKVIRLLRLMASQAIAAGVKQSFLPDPMARYYTKITAVPGAALFDIYVGKTRLNINGAAWTEAGQTEVWGKFESLYLGLAGSMDLRSIARAPVMPESLPWLTTLILPSPQAIAAPWLAEIEECLALALIDADRPRRD